jgi:hypothetical protein
MDMKIQRKWATPVTAGALVLMAITGILMFFDLDSGLNHEAHEWFSWVFLVGVAMHLTANFEGIKGHLSKPLGKLVVAIFVAILGLSFLNLKAEKESENSPWLSSVELLANLPLNDLQTISHLESDVFYKRLKDQGFDTVIKENSLKTLVDGDIKKEVQTLHALLE